ncbi:MAG TPA: choice-of-anchor D domain-containing protein [Candidatus Acidoferrales bacterium]|nr:choice-of-anchor D domain-containing protein [Candidatus Acidoferrales bacterium]
MRRVLTVFALFAALLWIFTNAPAPARAQHIVTPVHAGSAQPIVIASGGQFAGVRGLAVDTAGNLYVSLVATPAPANCVSHSGSSQFDSSSHLASNVKIALTVFSDCASTPTEEPSGIAVNPEGRVFLANQLQNRIRLLDMTSGKVTVVPASASRNIAHSSSSLDLFQPAGLALDEMGENRNLYVADRGNHRVLALAPGAADFTFVTHVLDAAAIAVAATSDRLYVASPASNRVFSVDLASGNAIPFAGTGASPDLAVARFATPVSALNAAIASPQGLAIDGAGNIFIADTGANAILRVDAKSKMLTRVSLASSLNSPAALAMDRFGNLFVADRGNQRVVEFPGVGAPAPVAAVTISPSQFDFGDEPTGGTTPAQPFTLTNNSANSLALSTTDFTFTGTNPNDFTQTNNCVPQVVAGGSCQINVTFAPQGKGARQAVLQVADADPSSPQTAQLSGTGDDFQITVAASGSTTQNVIPGNSATFNLQISPDATFNGTVTPVCPLQLPNVTLTCAVKPTTVNVTAGQPAAFTVTIGTGGPNATATSFAAPLLRNFPRGPMRPLFFLALAAMFVILISGISLRSPRARLFVPMVARNAPRRRAFARFSFAVVATCAAITLAGCRGSSTPANPNETPPGIFTINISATAQNASRAITLTVNVD